MNDYLILSWLRFQLQGKESISTHSMSISYLQVNNSFIYVEYVGASTSSFTHKESRLEAASVSRARRVQFKHFSAHTSAIGKGMSWNLTSMLSVQKDT